METALFSRTSEISAYFSFLNKQNQSFATNPAIISQIKALSSTFEKLGKRSSGERERLNTAVTDFYQSTFREKYLEQNASRNLPDPATFANLPTDTLKFQHDFIVASPFPMGEKHQLDQTPANTDYDRVHQRIHPYIRAFMEAFGYYDIFLIEAESGKIVYSVYKEIDFATSLTDGPFRDSGLGKAFRAALALQPGDQAAFIDYATYLPSYNAPASFIASPIRDGDQVIGVVAFQIPLDRIANIMAEHVGLGESGEILLIGQDGLPRSDSRFDPTRYSVNAAYRKGSSGRMNFPAIQTVFNQNQSIQFDSRDYLEREVLGVATPMTIGGQTWAVVATEMREEALAKATELANQGQGYRDRLFRSALWILIPTLLIVLALTTLVVRSIVNPIERIATFAKRVAEGDLCSHLQLERRDELGNLGAAIDDMVDHLNETIKMVINSAEMLLHKAEGLDEHGNQLESSTKATTEQAKCISGRARQMTEAATGIAKIAAHTAGQAKDVLKTVNNLATEAEQVGTTANEINQNIHQVSAAVEEVTATIAEISHTCSQSSHSSQEGANYATTVSNQVKHLADSANKIDAVITLIKSISEQTNLLALNATIEAAAAGSAGAGFAVVASEVKALAQKTGEATGNIFKQVRALQQDSQVAESGIGPGGRSIGEFKSDQYVDCHGRRGTGIYNSGNIAKLKPNERRKPGNRIADSRHQ